MRTSQLSSAQADLLETSKSSPSPTLFTVATFLSLPTSIYRTSATSIPSLVASYLVAKPLWWAMEQLGIAGEEGLLSSSTSRRSTTAWHGDYVLVHLVEKATDVILAKRRASSVLATETLYTFEGFRKAFCLSDDDTTVDAMLGELDAKMILRYLERDKGLVTVDNGVRILTTKSHSLITAQIIKFFDKDAAPETRKITAVDAGILELKTAVANLHSQVDGIAQRKEQWVTHSLSHRPRTHAASRCTEKAAEAVKRNQRNIALSYLRTRKQLEELLERRLSSLANLEGTLITVEAAAGDIEVRALITSPSRCIYDSTRFLPPSSPRRLPCEQSFHILPSREIRWSGRWMQWRRRMQMPKNWMRRFDLVVRLRILM